MHGLKPRSLRESADRRLFPSSSDAPTDLRAVEHWIASDGATPEVRQFHEDLRDKKEGTILFEDDHLLVVDKPAGVNTHFSPRVVAGALEIARLLRQDDDIRSVHNVDKRVTGVLLMAKGAEAARNLRRQLADRVVSGMEIRYAAIMEGPMEVGRTLKTSVGIAKTLTDRMSVVYPGQTRGNALLETERESLTYFTPVGVMHNEDYNSTVSCVEVTPQTSVVHQVRVVAGDHLRRPVVGDRYYGARENPFTTKLLLHVSSLRIGHPEDGHMRWLEAPVPQVFDDFMANYEWVDPAAIPNNEGSRQSASGTLYF